MATQKQRKAARQNVTRAQAGARKKKTITKLPRKTRTALGREGAKAAARKRGASKGTPLRNPPPRLAIPASAIVVVPPWYRPLHPRCPRAVALQSQNGDLSPR